MQGQFDETEFWLMHSEISIASHLIKRAMNSISQTTLQAESQLASMLFDLSIGLERLFKTLYILLHRDQHQSWPGNNELRNLGHKLYTIASRVQEMSSSQIDRKFVEDEPYKSILNVLTEFATSTRYFNLDQLVGRHSDSPFLNWHEKVEKQILALHPPKTLKLTEIEAMVCTVEHRMSVRQRTYDGGFVTSAQGVFVMGKQYQAIQKNLKVYIGRLVRAYSSLLDDHPNACAFAEFFYIFRVEDRVFRDKKDFTKL